MGANNKPIFDEIRQRVRLSQYLPDYFGVTIERSGMFLCKFHKNTDTPAAHLVSEERWHCFVCQEGGDVLDFVQKALNIPLGEALRVVAGHVGLKISEEDSENARRNQALRERTKSVLVKAQAELLDDMKAGLYLEGRGLTAEAVAHFGLGYNASIRDREGKDLGDAISIPLNDAFNRIVGYSMRMLNPDVEPKYRNSWEDDYGLFKKKEILYNLGACRSKIKKQVMICEGYFDVMTLWMLGFTESVGVCQAIMTKEQCKILHEAIKADTEIVLIPDLDEPGLDALEKNVALLRAYSKERVIRVAEIKNAKDVSQKFVEAGFEATKADILNTVPAEQFILDRIAKKEKDKTRQYSLARPVLANVTPLMRDDLVQYLSQLWNKDRALLAAYFESQGLEVSLDDFANFHDRHDAYNLYVSKLTQKRVRFGIPSIDRMMRGIAPAEICLIQARPSVGKTAVALNLGGRMSLAGHQVLMFSMEQQKEAIFEREMQIANGLTGSEIEHMTLTQDPRLDDYRDNAYTMFKRLHVVDRGRMKLSQIKEYILKFAAMHEMPQTIIVDYLTYIRPEAGDSRSEFDQISDRIKDVKGIAKEFGNCWIMLHQLSRKGGTGGDPVTSEMGRGCVVGETLIMLSNGQRVPIRNLVGTTPEVVCMDKNSYQSIHRKAVKVWKKKSRRDVFMVETQSGRRIRTTASHPFFTADRGFINLRNLKIGDSVAVVESAPFFGNMEMIAPELIGHLIANGALTTKTIEYTSGHKDILAHVSNLVKRDFPLINPHPHAGVGSEITITLSMRQAGLGRPRNPLLQYVKAIGCWGVKAPQKRAPNCVFSSRKSDIAGFLRGYFSGDGHVTNRGIFACSASRGLLEDISHLLSRFGIRSSIGNQEKPGGYAVGANAKGCWRLAILHARSIVKFADEIGLNCRKGEKLKSVAASFDGSRHRSGEFFPKELWSELHSSRKKNKLPWTAFGKSGVFENRKIARSRLKFMAESVGCKRLSLLANGDFFFDPIVSIEKDGREDVFDMTVVGHSNFIGNDICLKNSGVVEEAVDHIMGLWRPELAMEISPEEKSRRIQESKLCIGITKQKNGPTGQIDLVFDKKSMRLDDGFQERPPSPPAAQAIYLPGQEAGENN